MREITRCVGAMLRDVADRDHQLIAHHYERLGGLLKKYKQDDDKYEQWLENKDAEVCNEKSKL